jgi:TPR repeat protein
MYSRGKGVLEDDEKTICWFKKAADQGHRDAQYHMGELYIKGQRVERDLKRAKYWIEKSLESTDENIIRKSKHLWKRHNLEKY